MLHRVVVKIDQVQNVDQSTRNTPVDTSKVSSCQIAAKTNLLNGTCFITFINHGCSAWRVSVEFNLFFLIGFYKINFFIFWVDAIEDLFVVSRQT